jgi:hypothetical protein
VFGARFADDRPSYKWMAKFADTQQHLFDENKEAISCLCGEEE